LEASHEANLKFDPCRLVRQVKQFERLSVCATTQPVKLVHLPDEPAGSSFNLLRIG
jgi:hypothetical protein